MKRFHEYMEEWTQEQLQMAPPGMRRGWFTSHLEFFDLQDSIAKGTPVAMGVSIGIATAVAFLTTLNVLITLHAMLSIAGSIFTTVGVLIMLGWELNILESVIISIAVGLSIDFSLHYAMAYRLSPHSDREMRVVTSISRMGSPVAMAALTTFLVGAIMMPSTVLAYRKLGTFLMVVMSMSWAFATFFFQALLRTLGPAGGFGQFSWPSCDCFDRERDHVDKTVYTMSESTLSSVGTHGNSAEMHELEPLTMAERLEAVHGRNLNHRPRPHNRYQPRVSIASNSSADSGSPRSRHTSGNPADSPLTRRAVPSGTGAKSAGESSKRSSNTDVTGDEANADDASIKKNTVVSLTGRSGTTKNCPTVQLVPTTSSSSDPTRQEDTHTKEPVIRTDSNSNRTDKHGVEAAGQSATVGGAAGGEDADSIWLKQPVPVAAQL